MNLNTFDDIARDFWFYEDPADEFKNPDGNLAMNLILNLK